MQNISPKTTMFWKSPLPVKERTVSRRRSPGKARINQVDEEIDPHHPGGEKQVDSGNHRVVSVIEDNQQETTYPRQVKDVLHDHGAADQDWQLQADQGDHRDEGILDGVSDHHDLLLEPLGPGRSNIVLPEHLQHHGARHPHGGCRQGRPQNQAGDEAHREKDQDGQNQQGEDDQQ